MRAEELYNNLLQLTDDSIVIEAFYDFEYEDVKELFDIKNRDKIIKLFQTLSPKAMSNLLACMNGELDTIEYIFPFVFDLFTYNRESFTHLLTIVPYYTKEFFKKYSKDEEKKEIFKKLNDQERIAIFSSFYGSHSEENMLKFFFDSHQDIIDYVSRIPLEEAKPFFYDLPISEQKHIAMSNIDNNLLRELLKYSYDRSTRKNNDPKLKQFVFDSFMFSFEHGNKTGALLLINFINYARSYGSEILPSRYLEEAFATGETNIAFTYSKSQTLAFPKLLTSSCGFPVALHELGHYMFRTVYNSNYPKEYDTAIETAKERILGAKKEELNTLFEQICIVRNMFVDKTNSAGIDETLQKIILSYLKDTLKPNIIDYMRKNNYSEAATRFIEKHFDKLTIDSLTNVGAYDEIESIIHALTYTDMGEYFMFEDLINSIFGGEITYIDPSKEIDRTSGHPVSYFNDDKKTQFNEGIANFVSISLMGNKELLDKLRSILGEELFGIFENALLDFACYGIPEEDVELRTQIKEQLHFDSGRSLNTTARKYESLIEEDMIAILNNHQDTMFANTKKASNGNMFYYSTASTDNYLDIFTSNPLNLPEHELLDSRKSVYIRLSQDEKEEVMELKELDLHTKQELILYDVVDRFKYNIENLSAIYHLVNKLFMIDTDILSIFAIVRQFEELEEAYPDFSLFDAAYPESATLGR